MNLKNNLIVASSFFCGYALYMYFMMGLNKYDLFQIFGISAIFAAIADILMQFYLMFQTKIKSRSKNEWAIITGCTSGLGYSISKQLAEQGFNLILIGRNKDLLQKLVTDVSHTHVKTYTIIHDFNDKFDTLQEKINNFINNNYEYTISVLVNNVAIALEDLTKFIDYPLYDDYKIIDLNVKSIVSMTKVVLPKMINQKYGYIVNVGSASSLNPSPYVSTYSASKAFLDQFTSSMSHEYHNSGVKFYASHPAFFVSGMTKVNPSLFVPNNEIIADGILRHMNVTTSSIPYIMHYVQMSFVKYHWYKKITKVVLDNLYKSKQERLAKRKFDKKTIE